MLWVSFSHHRSSKLGQSHLSLSHNFEFPPPSKKFYYSSNAATGKVTVYWVRWTGSESKLPVVLMRNLMTQQLHKVSQSVLSFCRKRMNADPVQAQGRTYCLLAFNWFISLQSSNIEDKCDHMLVCSASLRLGAGLRILHSALATLSNKQSCNSRHLVEGTKLRPNDTRTAEN